MVWTAGDNYLLQTEVVKVSDSNNCPVYKSDGRVLSHGAKYLLVSKEARILNVYSLPITYCLDDEWGICSIYQVSETALYDYHWIENSWTRERRLLESVIFSDLKLCHKREVPFKLASVMK